MDHLVLRCALGSLALALSASAAPLDEPFSDVSLDDAKALVEEEDRILVLYFHHPDETESTRMLTETFGDQRVRDWIEQFGVALKIDWGDRQPIQRYGITRYPTTLMLGKKGKLLHRMEHYREAKEVLVAAQQAVLALGDITRPDGAQIENPMAWLAWGNWLFNNDPSRAEEALDAYLWCLDNGEEHIEGFREMYLEFLLERIAYLKRRTERAVEALWNRRRAKSNMVLSPEGTVRDLEEYLRFNFWLRHQQDSLDLMEQLLDRDGEHYVRMRMELLRRDLQQLTAFRRFETILELEPNPFVHISGRLDAWEEKESSPDLTPGDRERAEIVQDAGCYFEALIATGRAGDGMKLTERVLAAAPTARAYRMFMERTNRQQLFALTERLGKEALEVVTDAKGRNLIEAELRRAKKPKERTTVSPFEHDHDKDGR